MSIIQNISQLLSNNELNEVTVKLCESLLDYLTNTNQLKSFEKQKEDIMSSLFDFIESIYFDLSMNYQFKKDLGLIFVDLVQDVYTMITNGFIEMVIKGNLDYQTSSTVKSIAKNELSEAVDKYNQKCLKTTNLLKCLNRHITNSYARKYNNPKLTNNQFNINTKTFNFNNLEDNYKLLTSYVSRHNPLLDRQIVNIYKTNVEE